MSGAPFDPLRPQVVFGDIPVDRLRAAVLAMMMPVDRPDVTGFDQDFGALDAAVAQQQMARLARERPEMLGQHPVAAGEFASAILPINRGKNRYSNVLPPERTLLRLQVTELSQEGDDYINANLVTGLDLPPDLKLAAANPADPSHSWVRPTYIATQGPLEWTIGDFWRMVWEQNVSVVIMLTKEVENGRVKCGHYWPEDGTPVTQGRYYAFQTDVDMGEELVTRHITLEDSESGETRKVTQFLYTAWPDHGLPPSTTAYLELSRRADDANHTNAPLVVHCSAGIGRTGTFCTVHSTVELLQWQMEEQVRQYGRCIKPPTCNIPETVVHLRLQRPGMIQTREQYMFCFLAIMEEAERLLTEYRYEGAPSEDTDDVAESGHLVAYSESEQPIEEGNGDDESSGGDDMFSLGMVHNSSSKMPSATEFPVEDEKLVVVKDGDDNGDIKDETTALVSADNAREE